MAPPREQSACLAFASSSGETIKLHDLLCWRQLEGRSCISAAERNIGRGVRGEGGGRGL